MMVGRGLLPKRTLLKRLMDIGSQTLKAKFQKKCMVLISGMFIFIIEIFMFIDLFIKI